jgi:hypothetical protein
MDESRIWLRGRCAARRIKSAETLNSIEERSDMELTGRHGHWLRNAIAVVLALALVAGTIYFIDPEILGFPGPRKTVLTFVKAYNDRDINVLLTCVDSRIERGVRGMSNIIGGLFGVNSKDLFDILPMLAAVVGNQGGNPQLENVQILSKSVSGDTAALIATMDERRTGAQGEQIAHLKILFRLKHEDTGWRISDMQSLL